MIWITGLHALSALPQKRRAVTTYHFFPRTFHCPHKMHYQCKPSMH
uniref:Uncharacterized protein n=1 Tax=Arundo donax TaxID=35708 RepID=A0A0A9DZM6_ARUDO